MATELEQWKTRAEAAERTVEVLKKKVTDLYNASEISTIHGQLEKAKRRDEENRKKREIAEVKTRELQKYSETLEAEVARRAEIMKTILNNVHFGFLLMDRQFKIQPDYSQYCETLLQQEHLQDKSLLDILDLSKRDREHFSLGIDQIYEDLLPDTVSLRQLPSRFDINNRIINAQGSVIRRDGVIDSILFTLSDVTDLEEAQYEANLNHVLLGILKQKEAFVDFVKECKQQLNEARVLLQANDQAEIRRNIHTIKGNAASWGLTDLMLQIHLAEDKPLINLADLDGAEDLLRNFVDTNYPVIGVVYDSLEEATYSISQQQIRKLDSIIHKIGDVTEESANLKQWSKGIQQKAAADMLGPIDEFVKKLALRLGKDVNFIFEGGDTQVDVPVMKGVLQTVIHLLRNAVDHGIEEPLERGRKHRIGKVRLLVGSDAEGYWLEVADDGRGINADRIAEIAKERGLVDAEQLAAMSQEQKLQLIFLDGLSSATQTTEISGRGVGMSAVQAEVNRAFGSIAIISKAGKGTAFKIRVPASEVKQSVA